MRLFSPRVIGYAAGQIPSLYSTGEIELLFITVGLGRFYKSIMGKAAIVAHAVKTATFAGQEEQDTDAIEGLNDLVKTVAAALAPKQPEEELEAGDPWLELQQRLHVDGFDLRAQYSDEGKFLTVRVLPVDDPHLPLGEEITALEHDLSRLGLVVALNHYRQAVNSYLNGDLEGSNGQVRPMLEAVMVSLAEQRGFVRPPRQGGGGPAINHLVQIGDLDERTEGQYLRGLWNMSHPNGPHPGTTTAAEARHRLTSLTEAARFLIDRLAPE